MAGFRTWATLENVGKAADLALKLAGIVAVLAVLSFFKGRGDVFPRAECWAPIGLGDADQVIAHDLHLTPEQAATPVAALQAWKKEPALPLGLGGESMRIGCGRDIAAVEDLRSRELTARSQAVLLGRPQAERPLSSVQRRQRMRLLRDEYPDTGKGIVHYVPSFAVVIAASPALSLRQVRKVLRFIEDQRQIKVIVDVENVGKADALDVTITPPRGFALSEQHPSRSDLPEDYGFLAKPGVQPIVYQDHPATDLSPGEHAYFILEGAGNAKTRTVHAADVVPKADTEPSINVTRQLVVFGLLVLLVLVPLVIRDVRDKSSAG
jgi:hypothetical protein